MKKTGKSLKCLLLYTGQEELVPNLMQKIHRTVCLSSHEIDTYNFNKNGMFDFKLDDRVILNIHKYDCIVIHESLSYSYHIINAIDKRNGLDFSSFRGSIVLIKQDEQHDTYKFDRYIYENRVSALLTCVPESEYQKAFPLALEAGCIIRTLPTCFFDDKLFALAELDKPEKTIDVSYRGAYQPARFGRLCQIKSDIGVKFEEHTADLSLELDISSLAKDRLNGKRWRAMLLNSRAVLGVESGGSLFDTSGMIDAVNTYHSFLDGQFDPNFGMNPDHAERVELILEELKSYENQIQHGQISPRHVEAAASDCLQIMYPGHFDGILEAGVHYVPYDLTKDSALEAVKILRDDVERSRIIDASRERLFNQPQLSESNYMGIFDKTVSEAFDKKLDLNPGNFLNHKLEYRSIDKKNIAMVCGHLPHIDPRLAHFANCAPENMRVHQFGVAFFSEEPYCRTNERGDLVIAYKAIESELNEDRLAEILLDPTENNLVGGHLLKLCDIACRSSDDQLAKLFDCLPDDSRILQFRWLLKYVLKITSTILNEVNVRGLDYIVAVDLPALPAALLLGKRHNVPVCYDAHEYWPEADVSSAKWESEYWRTLCQLLIPMCDLNVTVSAGLCELMEKEFGPEFLLVPNTEPLAVKLDQPSQNASRETRFIFQGSFAEQRGLEELVLGWRHAPEGALLYLRAKDNEIKNRCIGLAERYGMLDTTIFILEPVPEEEMVAALDGFDVGIIPYRDRGMNYRHCCPNKLSQYMAAGLPVLSNDLPFIREVLTRGECGIVCDMADDVAFVNALTEFMDPSKLKNMKKRAFTFFQEDFNFENHAKLWYEKINGAIAPNTHDFVYRHHSAAELAAAKPTVSLGEYDYDDRAFEYRSTMLWIDGFHEVENPLLSDWQLSRRLQQWVDRARSGKNNIWSKSAIINIREGMARHVTSEKIFVSVWSLHMIAKIDDDQNLADVTSQELRNTFENVPLNLTGARDDELCNFIMSEWQYDKLFEGRKVPSQTFMENLQRLTSSDLAKHNIPFAKYVGEVEVEYVNRNAGHNAVVLPPASIPRRIARRFLPDFAKRGIRAISG